jgi:3-oxoacyl-[acyl-carrier protein] reductase
MAEITKPLTLDLTGKVCVVTGATGELGRVMVRTLARCGADVAIQYHQNEAMAKQLQEELTVLGRRGLPVQADITDVVSVTALRDTVMAEMGTARIIVNNAVTQYDWTSVLQQSPADYESQFRSCVLHNVLMSQAFVPGMIAAGKGGRVIGINTECAMQNFESQSAYISGKRGMDGVLRVLAKEIGGHGITVNQVAPGWTISDKHRDGDPPDTADYVSKVPLRRRGTDQEIANVVAFLASDLASYITGVYLPVCGGNVMPGI